MTEPLFTVPPQLTPRQKAAFDYIAAHDGVPADELGAYLHAWAGVHAAYFRCDFCVSAGREVTRSKALKPLVTFRRTRDGNLYVLRNRQRTGSQKSELAGSSFEDIFGDAA